MLDSGLILKAFFFANLKKYWFYWDKICFLWYMVLSKKINMEAIKIEAVKYWPESKLVCNI